jgi:hypothetical protein
MDNSQPSSGVWQLGSGDVCDSDPLARGDNSPLSWSCLEVPPAIGGIEPIQMRTILSMIDGKLDWYAKSMVEIPIKRNGQRSKNGVAGACGE